jgi:hypothetical protein
MLMRVNLDAITIWLNEYLPLLNLLVLIVYTSANIALWRVTKGMLAVNRRMVDEMGTTRSGQEHAAFESTFLAMVRVHQGLVRGMELVWTERRLRAGVHAIPPVDRPGDFEEREVRRNGRTVFGILWSEFKEDYRQTEGDPVKSREPDEQERERIKRAYQQFFEKRQPIVGHYFRNLYNIIKYVNGVNVADKQHYVNLLRAQLSSQELLLLFYNCLTPERGWEKFYRFIEQFSFLEGMPQDQLTARERQISLFDARAYKEPELSEGGASVSA